MEFEAYEEVVAHKDWLAQDEEIAATVLALQLAVTWYVEPVDNIVPTPSTGAQEALKA